MKRYEKESLLKNFFVFFSLLEILLVLLFTELYHTEKREYRQTLFQTMQVCSYTLACEEFTFDFVSIEKGKPNTLYETDTLYSYFTIPKSDKFYLRIAYSAASFKKDMQKIIIGLLLKFILATLLLFGTALFFTFYSLKPIRKAVRLNDEFVKDILHDFNTPITSMVLNLKMFKVEHGENTFAKRISHSIDTLLFLQNNLKSFLFHTPTQKSEIDIGDFVNARMLLVSNTYPKIIFSCVRNNTLVKVTHPEILARIFDNLLSNAAKYNKTNGSVIVTVNNTEVVIEDTGKGIEDVEKVMHRYYKEQERGLGIGLHIVQKLVTELDIDMKIISQKGQGTSIILDFKNLREKQI